MGVRGAVSGGPKRPLLAASSESSSTPMTLSRRMLRTSTEVTARWRYRVTSLIRKRTTLGPYLRRMPRVLGGGAVFHERGTPVGK